MFTLEIRFLTGRFAAASYHDHTLGEWPPHPARIFSALTAALHDEPDPDSEEREALEWLAGAGAPEIFASDAFFRQLGEVYVPTNDQRVLGDLDRHLEKLERAEAALESAEGKDGAKAERAVARASEALAQRSVASGASSRAAPATAAELLNRRLRPQPRSFPAAIPDADVVHVRWPDEPPSRLSEALDRVAARVTRLGHSSSLVSIRTTGEEVGGDGRKHWQPDPAGDVVLRVTLPDQLRLLEEAHEQHRQVDQRTLPARQEPYIEASTEPEASEEVRSSFAQGEEWIVFEVVEPPEGGRRLLLDASLAQHVARALRGTLLRQLGTTGPESLTGHDSHGHPTARPHLTFLPLPFVRHPHATGSILGVALIPPGNLPPTDRDTLLEAVFRAELEAGKSAGMRESAAAGPPPLRLTLGRHGVLHVRRLRDPSTSSTLKPGSWIGPARRWVSATGVALDRNPGNLRSRDPDVVTRATAAAEAIVSVACANIGLPEPEAVWIHQRSLLSGAPAARRFMPFPDQGEGPRRVCVHVELVFGARIRGPVILGAGRFFGLGLCRPWER